MSSASKGWLLEPGTQWAFVKEMINKGNHKYTWALEEAELWALSQRHFGKVGAMQNNSFQGFQATQEGFLGISLMLLSAQRCSCGIGALRAPGFHETLQKTPSELLVNTKA